MAKQARMVDVFLRYMQAEGATVVFGVPGGLLHPFFEAVEANDEFRLIVTKHEEGAAFMADGYARVGRRLAICAGTAGPGATNLLTGVSVAYADGVPLLVVTGQAATYGLGKGAAQETSQEYMDTTAIFRPVTKYSVTVNAPDKLSLHLRHALRLALMGRPGPVHLSVPVDLWEHPMAEDWFDPTTYRPETHQFDRHAVQAASRLLMASKRPVLLAGAGVATSGAQKHLATLAELLPARVATTPRGKGVFPEDHPLSLGVLGFAGHRGAREAVLGSEVDVLMTVGASLNETTTFNWHAGLKGGKALIQLDIAADRVGRNYPVDVPLVGDAQTVLIELIYHLHRALREDMRPASVWPQEPPPPEGDARYSDPELRRSEQLPVTPQRWRAELSDVLPDDAVVFSDVGGHMLFNIHHLMIRRDQQFVLNLGFGSMGHGTAAPIGAALALGARCVVAIIGDACFTMNGMELLTAAEYQIPVIWIIENNQMHGITWHGSHLVGSKRPMDAVVYRRPLDITSIARAMGLLAWTVERPGQLTEAMASAMRAGVPCVIEVRVDGRIPPPIGERARSISGFSAE
ncbi:MAG: thiamine pyrophosphate-binding protein [Polyangiaceae bacterium]